MHRLSQIAILLLVAVRLNAQSPHGEAMKMDCAQCHVPADWTSIPDSIPFDHDLTRYPLAGAHAQVDCKSCHATLVFNEAPGQCNACHADIHSLSVGDDCARCHTPKSWVVDGIPELHEENGFPLIGAHGNLSCVDCHTSEPALQFGRNGNDCISCHQDDLMRTRNPDHTSAGFSTDCIQCHDPLSTGWETDIIDHDFFPLTMGHAISDCSQCHTGGSFATASPECISCHQDDYAATVDPGHTAAGFSTDCATCHTTSPGWAPATYDHDTYPLVGAHAAASCTQCHNGNYTNTPNTCDGCHLPDYAATTNPNHTAAGFATDCATCHNETAWSPSSYDHSSYPLVGSHTTVSCDQCHNGNYNNTPNTCNGCHLPDYNATTNPNHTAAGFATDCATCHNETAWSPSSYDHSSYPLVGSHTTVSCDQCHNGNYNNTPNTCDGCHLPDYNATTNPNHTAAGFATDCATCHNETAWSPSSYDHSSYPLVGSHTTVSCDQCHNGNYNNTPNTCNGCHLPDYNATTNPNHTAAGFATDCATCHNETAWSPSSYDHSSYPLVGSHTTVSCDQCHNGNYNNTPNTCNGCHLPDYTATTNPNHVAAQFPTDCAQCHDETAWTPSSYNHNITGFPLTGGHTGVDCLQCHANGYQGTPTNCDACHMPEYNATTNPNHAAAQFPTDCALCHDESAWGNSTFDHNTTNFPLTGGHAGVNCLACHSNGYQGTPTNCDACHMPDFNGTTNPNHTAAQFGTNCTQCHDETAWTPSTYNHNITGFPLTGGHTGVDCLQCHANGFQGTPSNCDACHMPDYNGTTNPNHAAAQFPTDCALCHTESAWSPSNYDHSGFPLLGSHTTVSCNQCHNGNYNNTPNTCAGCHMPDYNGTTNPNHAAAQFPTDCALCHGETSWVPSTYDHNATGFPLTGGHAGVNCLQCHSNGYQGTPTDCDACHMAEYNGTNNPDHQTAQFPTDCAQCHSISAWVPSTFDHDAMYFPIYSGNHNGEWNTCAECHTNPNDYSVFSCIICHDNQGQLANDHSGENGYAYNSAACFNCHPNGN